MIIQDRPKVLKPARHESRVLVYRARDLIADAYDKPISLEDAAKEACLSPFHFHRLFAQTFGQTPHDFLTQRRIEAAKKLLVQSNMSVTEICFEVGYSSLGSFSSLFQRVVGCSPTDYRIGAARFHSLYRIWSHRFIPTCFTRSWM
jgi:AraC-like DNA-binding protein